MWQGTLMQISYILILCLRFCVSQLQGLLRHLHLNVYWGHRLITSNVSNPHDSLQDEGVHLQFALNL